MTNIMESRAGDCSRSPRRRRTSACRVSRPGAQTKIYLHIGSLAIKVSPDKAANRAFVIDPRGAIVARYDKIHMFDVDLEGGESYREFAQIFGLAKAQWRSICHSLDLD